MSDALLLLHIDGTAHPVLRAQPEETPEALLARALTRWPFLPITHLSCNGVPVGYLQHYPLVDEKRKPTPVAPRKKRKQGYAERYRQHWIDKDNAKKSP